MKMKHPLLTWLAASAAVVVVELNCHGQTQEDYERSPINYSASQPTEIISRLQARLAAGDLKLAGNDKEIVRALLRELKIPVESQLLVFSKTSLQRGRIGPDSPRAIYFSDSCYVGWVPGGLLEVASIDASLGPIFYSFDPRPQAGTTPGFVRDPDCLRCHGGTFVPHIPAVFARSVFPDAEGEPLFRQGTQVVDYRTAFEERWGGWYVTGRHGQALHRGNICASEKNGALVVDPGHGANITNLGSFFRNEKYLTNSSDIVALLVFEHQLAAHNALTRAAFNCRRMIDYQKSLQEAFKEPVSAEPAYDSVKSVFDGATREVVNVLLFKDEAPLPAGIEGSRDFVKAFEGSGLRGPEGHSLKDLLMKGHLFKHRCSYLIYSESFLNLPQTLKQRVYERLTAALQPTQPNPEYAYLGPDERTRIMDILRHTHAELREFWQRTGLN
jgi:hypothetical protein